MLRSQAIPPLSQPKPSTTNLFKSSLVLAVALGVVFTTACTGVPFEYRVGGELSTHQGNTLTGHLPSRPFYSYVDPPYHLNYGSQLLLAAPVLTPATPPLLHDNTSSGMEKAAEEAKRKDTCPIRSIKEVSNKRAHISVHSEVSTKVCEFLWLFLPFFLPSFSSSHSPFSYPSFSHTHHLYFSSFRLKSNYQ